MDQNELEKILIQNSKDIEGLIKITEMQTKNIEMLSQTVTQLSKDVSALKQRQQSEDMNKKIKWETRDSVITGLFVVMEIITIVVIHFVR